MKTASIGRFWYLVMGAVGLMGLLAFLLTPQLQAHIGPVADGVIHSCVNNSSGTIFIVGETEDCKKNQTSVDWNAQGLEGEAGADGRRGRSHRVCAGGAVLGDAFTVGQVEAHVLGQVQRPYVFATRDHAVDVRLAEARIGDGQSRRLGAKRIGRSSRISTLSGNFADSHDGRLPSKAHDKTLPFQMHRILYASGSRPQARRNDAPTKLIP